MHDPRFKRSKQAEEEAQEFEKNFNWAIEKLDQLWPLICSEMGFKSEFINTQNSPDKKVQQTFDLRNDVDIIAVNKNGIGTRTISCRILKFTKDRSGDITLRENELSNYSKFISSEEKLPDYILVAYIEVDELVSVVLVSTKKLLDHVDNCPSCFDKDNPEPQLLRAPGGNRFLPINVHHLKEEGFKFEYEKGLENYSENIKKKYFRKKNCLTTHQVTYNMAGELSQ